MRDYGKAYAIEFAMLKTKIDNVKYKAAKYFLAIITIALIPIAPIAIISAYFYYQIYVKKAKKFSATSKTILLIAITSLIVYSTFIFLFTDYPINSALWQIPYLVGAIIALYYFNKNIK